MSQKPFPPKHHSRSKAAQTPPGQSWFPCGSGLRCSSGRRTLVESPRAHVGTAALLQALLDCFSCHINNSSTSSQPALISPRIFLLRCCSSQSKYAKLCLLHTEWAQRKTMTSREALPPSPPPISFLLPANVQPMLAPWIGRQR